MRKGRLGGNPLVARPAQAWPLGAGLAAAWLLGALEAQVTQWFIWGGLPSPAFLVEVGLLQRDLLSSSLG